MSVKEMGISLKVDYDPSSKGKPEPVAFVEISTAGKTYLLPGKLEMYAAEKKKEYRVTAQCEPFQKGFDAHIGAGVFILPQNVKRVFHPVQHQFKIKEERMQQDASGVSRRRNADGTSCDDGRGGTERPQMFYPACKPAAWAALCSAYRLTPQNPRRRWELGTPTETNPPPNESGDYFSTWAMGGKHQVPYRPQRGWKIGGQTLPTQHRKGSRGRSQYFAKRLRRDCRHEQS
jgi:hypothetical protein